MSAGSAGRGAAARPGPSQATRRRGTLVAVTLGLGITILDETVVFLALPAIDRDLGIGLAGQQWVVNGYLLPLAALLLPAGSLADRYGRRRLFVLGLLGFALASLAAGLAPTGGVLIAARVVQGGFAALLMPSTLALLVATFRGEERGSAIGTWAAWSAVAAVIGPLVAGVLITTLSWRWVFFLSVPVVAVAVGLTVWVVPESRDDRAREQPLDLTGAALAVLSVAGLSFAVVQGPERGWSTATVLAAALLTPVALVGFVLRQRRAPMPMLPLAVFRSRAFVAANAATLALYAAFNGGSFLVTIYLQTVLGYSALEAGAATLPLTVLMLLLAHRFGRLGERVGPRLPMTVGQLLAAGGLLWLGLVEPGDGYLADVLPGVLLFGTGLALTVAPLTDTAVSALPDEDAGLASGVNNVAARLAALLGVALVGLVFAVSFRAGLDTPRDAAGALGQAAREPTSALQQPLDPAERDQVLAASAQGYRWGMWAGAALALGGAVVALGAVPSSAPGTSARRASST